LAANKQKHFKVNKAVVVNLATALFKLRASLIEIQFLNGASQATIHQRTIACLLKNLKGKNNSNKKAA
jgi:hypothetical protein